MMPLRLLWGKGYLFVPSPIIYLGAYYHTNWENSNLLSQYLWNYVSWKVGTESIYLCFMEGDINQWDERPEIMMSLSIRSTLYLNSPIYMLNVQHILRVWRDFWLHIFTWVSIARWRNHKSRSNILTLCIYRQKKTEYSYLRRKLFNKTLLILIH